MIRKINSETMGRGDHGWLRSLFHFSFADYYSADNINFGVLRVLNDDLVDRGTGFDLHPHRDMEIISYVVDGQLTHADSMGNKHTLTRGQVQYMSAGTGVFHSEHNHGSETLRFLQIWLVPDARGHKPNYGDHAFAWEDRKDKWLPIVSGSNKDVPIQVHQDVNLYVTELSPGKSLNLDVGHGRQAYVVQIEGAATINDEHLNQRDGLEVTETPLTITAEKSSHILVIEMARAED